MLTLGPEELHSSLSDPVLGSMGFLNEVMSRYPDAISFAPGAPYAALVDGVDIGDCVDAYLDHLRTDRGLNPVAARRLLYEYGPSRGIINDLVAQVLRRDLGIDVAPQAIVITVGAQEAMLLTLRTLIRSEQDLLAVVNPCYVGIMGAARLLDVGVVPVPETAEGVDVDALEAACVAARARGRRVRALYVAADFANPSGAAMDLPARNRLLAAADRHDLIVLEDSAYGFTAVPEQALPTLKALDRSGRVVYLGTFAKLCLPGARVGFVVADQPVRAPDGDRTLADELATVKTMVTVNTSPIAQAVVGGMVIRAGGSLAALAAPRAELYRRNLTLLLDTLDKLDNLPAGVTWNRPHGGFFVRMRLPWPADANLLNVSASTFGVLWTPMSMFHLDGGGRDEIRLSCSYLEPAEIVTGAERLAAFLRHVAG
jgi:(S)-3,5-dihydroxyphenylglycine transaminase